MTDDPVNEYTELSSQSIEEARKASHGVDADPSVCPECNGNNGHKFKCSQLVGAIRESLRDEGKENMVTECRHGVTQCPDCLQSLSTIQTDNKRLATAIADHLFGDAARLVLSRREDEDAGRSGWSKQVVIDNIELILGGGAAST